MKRNDVFLACALFLLAFVLRFTDLSYPNFRWMDETGHVPAASTYWQVGQSDPDNWEHPPLRHIILYGFLQVFGDNPYGWRIRNVLFGALAALLTYLFALSVSGSRRTALLAGLLLATDPLHIVLSRYTYEEIYGGALFLAAIVIYLLRGRSSTGFALSALFMGCALATKWYYLPGWLLVLLLALQEDGNYRDPKTVLFLTCIYLFLPLCVYLASYYPWFGRGYTLGEFADFTINAYRSLQSYQPGSYDQQLLFLNHISAGAWFTGAVIVGRGTYLSDSLGEFIVYMNDLPIWVLALPALLSMGIIAVRKRSWLIAAPVLLFFATYVLFLFVDRPVFLYSAAPLLPFAFTAIAYGVTQLAEKFHVRIYHVTLAAMLAWSLYLYPFVTAKKVPVAPYSFILNHGEIKIH